MKRFLGLGSIEWMILISIGAIIISVVVKTYSGARESANEARALAFLRELVPLQERYRASCGTDVDGDGIGEYACFHELASVALPTAGRAHGAAAGFSAGQVDATARGLRTARDASGPTSTLLAPRFGVIQDHFLLHDGYYYMMCLPSAPNLWSLEERAGGRADFIDPQHAERHWACFAWPAEWGESGRRAFYVDQSGTILETPNSKGRYDGPRRPEGFSAVRARGVIAPGTMASPLAIGETSLDGSTWHTVR